MFFFACSRKRSYFSLPVEGGGEGISVVRDALSLKPSLAAQGELGREGNILTLHLPYFLYFGGTGNL